MTDLRKIDALVAEHVMEWQWYFPDGWSHIDAERNGEGKYLAPGAYLPDGRGFQTLTVLLPSYSSDIAAAWEVVEKLGGALGKYGIGWDDGRVHEDIYEARLPDPRWTKENNLPMLTDYGSSWEQAWCRVLEMYLEAVGVAIPTAPPPASPGAPALS